MNTEDKVDYRVSQSLMYGGRVSAHVLLIYEYRATRGGDVIKSQGNLTHRGGSCVVCLYTSLYKLGSWTTQHRRSSTQRRIRSEGSATSLRYILSVSLERDQRISDVDL